MSLNCSTFSVLYKLPSYLSLLFLYLTVFCTLQVFSEDLRSQSDIQNSICLKAALIFKGVPANFLAVKILNQLQSGALWQILCQISCFMYLVAKATVCHPNPDFFFHFSFFVHRFEHLPNIVVHFLFIVLN